MSKLGNLLDKCKVIDPKLKEDLSMAIKMEKKGRLRVVKGLCKDCHWFRDEWGEINGKKCGKCMLAMTCVEPEEYCSKWHKPYKEE